MGNPLPTSGLDLPCAMRNFTGIRAVTKPSSSVYRTTLFQGCHFFLLLTPSKIVFKICSLERIFARFCDRVRFSENVFVVFQTFSMDPTAVY